jgi:hypothetical protein
VFGGFMALGALRACLAHVLSDRTSSRVMVVDKMKGIFDMVGVPKTPCGGGLLFDDLDGFF